MAPNEYQRLLWKRQEKFEDAICGPGLFVEPESCKPFGVVASQLEEGQRIGGRMGDVSILIGQSFQQYALRGHRGRAKSPQREGSPPAQLGVVAVQRLTQGLDGTSGPDLCEKMKARPALVDVPVMFLSAAQIPDIIRRSHALGGSYYVRKPFDAAVLLELIDKALWLPALVTSNGQP